VGSTASPQPVMDVGKLPYPIGLDSTPRRRLSQGRFQGGSWGTGPQTLATPQNFRLTVKRHTISLSPPTTYLHTLVSESPQSKHQNPHNITRNKISLICLFVYLFVNLAGPGSKIRVSLVPNLTCGLMLSVRMLGRPSASRLNGDKPELHYVD